MKTLKQILLLLFVVILITSCAKKESLVETDLAEDLLYKKAIDYYNDRKWDKAVEFFQKYIFTYPANRNTEYAQYYLADAYFNKKAFTEAIVEFEYFVKNYNTYNLKKDATYKLCISYYKLSPSYQFDQTLTINAISFMRDFLSTYYEDEKKNEIDSLHSILVSRLEEKKLHTGDFYNRIKKYRAAEIYYSLITPENLLPQYIDRYYFSLGKVLFNLGEYKRALENLTKVKENSKYYKNSRKMILKITKML